MKKIVSPPIRWVGSKRRFLNEMLMMFDRSKTNYIEPFMGSGVVFLNCIENNMYDNYYVNDINGNLSNLFIHIRDYPDRLLKKVVNICKVYNDFTSLELKSNFYYEKRLEFNSNSDQKSISQSVLFWFLMKAGYNGVFRVNLVGGFNVPFGKKEKIGVNTEHLMQLSKLTERVVIYNCDYLDFLNQIKKKIDLNTTFMYMDPPYIPETQSTQNHNLYTKERFLHDKLVDKIGEITGSSNISIMVSMSKSEKSTKIYYDGLKLKGFERYELLELLRYINPKKTINSIEEVYANYQFDISY